MRRILKMICIISVLIAMAAACAPMSGGNMNDSSLHQYGGRRYSAGAPEPSP